MGKGLDPLFKPKSVAVVGASANPQKLGHTLIKNLIDYQFQGEIYPINPRADHILGLKSYPSLKEINKPVDLVLVSIPNYQVLRCVKEAVESQANSLVVLSSGFGEASIKGKELERSILDMAKKVGMRILGPNCMGIYNIHWNLNGTYFWELPKLKGNISFVSQSGAYGGILFSQIRARNIGISKFVSIGNQMDITHSEVIEYLGEDVETSVISLFIEAIKDGEKFVEIARKVSKQKPIVVFKAGRTDVGRRAASSHTGSMAGNPEVYQAAFEQSGCIHVKDTEEFFDVSMALSAYSHNLPKDERLAIVTISGGPCVTASDMCEELGLSLPKLKDECREKIRKLIPEFGADSNPVDMTPQMNPENYQPCVKEVFYEDYISGVIAINVGLDQENFGKAFVEAMQDYKKPVLAFTLDTKKIHDIFHKNQIPIFPTPERVVKAYNGLVKYARILTRKEFTPRPPGKASELIRKVANGQYSVASRQRTRDKGQGTKEKNILDEHKAKRLFSEYEIPVVKEAATETMEDAPLRGKEIGYPLVVKVLAPGILHKSEKGGVLLGIRDAQELMKACKKIRETFGSAKFLIQEMVAGGIELIIGAKRDEVFGPVIAFGLGGIFTEVLKDFSIRIAPLTEEEALEMIKGIKGWKILEGYRGYPPCKIEKLVEIILKVSDIITGNEEILELDINPLIIKGDWAAALDGLVVLT